MGRKNKVVKVKNKLQHNRGGENKKQARTRSQGTGGSSHTVLPGNNFGPR